MIRTGRNSLFTMLATLALTGCIQVGGSAPKVVTPFNLGNTAAALPTVSCSDLPRLGPEFDQVIGRNALDPVLFEKSVLHSTNVRRCANGLNPLAEDSTLTRVASGHSSDMVRLGFFGHDSPVPGKNSLRDRMDAGNVSYRAFAENLATQSRLQLESGRPYSIQDATSCQFSYDGRPIEAHTYRSLGLAFVDAWEQSPGHRKNLLNPIYTRLGVGSAYKPNAKHCGDIVATQNFAA